MTKFLAATLLLAAAAAPVAAAEKTSFTHEGVTYVYTQKQVGDATVIQGRAMPGDSFSFTVVKGQVAGVANGMPVSFRVQDAVRVRAENQVASAR